MIMEREVILLKRSCVVLAFWLMAAWAAPGYGQEAAVKIADVYPRGARVVLEAPARPETTFDLPMSFEEDSIRVLGRGARILSVETSRIQRTGWVPPALAGLDARVKNARLEVDRLESRAASLQQTSKHLQDPVPSSWKPQDLLKFLDTAAKRREQAEKEIRDNARALDKAKAELSRLETELSGKMPPEPDAALRVRVKTSGAGSLRLVLWTPHASWNTRYALDLAARTGKVSFGQEALVQQKTGFDWDGEIILHTVQPRRTMTAPELPPLIADFRQERQRSDGIMMMKEAAVPDKAGETVQEETLTDLALKTRGRVSGEGTPSRISVASFSLPSETGVVVIPALEREAWLTAEIKALDRALLPGPAELSMDGSPSGRALIGTMGRGESLKLAFGRVPLVTSSLEEAVPREGTTWGRGRLEKAFTLSVTNGMGTQTAVKVLDRVPVSAQDKIKVEVLALDPKPSKQDDRGILSWDLTLAPGETKKLSLKYRLTYPADRALIFR